MLKNILKSTAIWMAATVSFTACEVDTTTVMFEEDHDFSQPGDTVFIHDFSRLARSTKDLLEMVETLQANGVHLASDKENLDTGTPTGKLMLTMIAAINEFERQNMLDRQQEGIEVAKQKGVYKGRKPTEYDRNLFDVLHEQVEKRILTVTDAAKQLGVTRQTWYRIAEQNR